MEAFDVEDDGMSGGGHSGEGADGEVGVRWGWWGEGEVPVALEPGEVGRELVDDGPLDVGEGMRGQGGPGA